MLSSLARVRVPLGFVSAAIAFGLARPSWRWWSVGFGLALAGELVRLWAAGHIDKGREITTSGPYRFVRHPLYLGSSLIGSGFAIAAQSLVVTLVVVVYLGVTLTAAMRTEEARLDEAFGGAYSDYRAGTLEGPARRFTWARVAANREYRAVAGLLSAFGVLLLRM